LRVTIPNASTPFTIYCWKMELHPGVSAKLQQLNTRYYIHTTKGGSRKEKVRKRWLRCLRHVKYLSHSYKKKT
jgi:hypothetical protein